MAQNLTLGIDIGTTKIAAVIADPTARVVLESHSLDHRADRINPHIPGSSEQSVDTIFDVVTEVVTSLNPEALRRIGAVGLTGQMHGVVLFDTASTTHSHLHTWQDNRCLHNNFISELQQLTHDFSLRSGFGTATLAWIARFQPELLHSFSRASTIHGYLAQQLCGADGGIDPSDAASFGLFDLAKRSWRQEMVQKSGIPFHILPDIAKPGSAYGTLGSTWAQRLRLPSGIPVAVPLGDNQASLFGSLSAPESQIALTIGTGGQVSVVLESLPASLPDVHATYEIRPYVDGKYIAVGASLGGGRTLAALARALQEFLESLNVSPLPDLENIYSVLQVLAGTRLGTDLEAVTCFSGERHDPSLRGSLANISFENFTMGDMFASLSKGIVFSLWSLLPSSFYEGKTEIVGSGNAIRRSSMMQRYIEEVFGIRLVVSPGGETTCSGAAFIAGRLL